MGHIHVWHHIFSFKKNLWSISMTFKIKISEFYDYSEPKQWNWNKIRHFWWDIFKSDIIFHSSQNTKKISMTFMIGIFQFHCKCEQKQVKSNDMCKWYNKSDIIFRIYNMVHYSNDFWNLFLDNVYHSFT